MVTDEQVKLNDKPALFICKLTGIWRIELHFKWQHPHVTCPSATSSLTSLSCLLVAQCSNMIINITVLPPSGTVLYHCSLDVMNGIWPVQSSLPAFCRDPWQTIQRDF